MEDQVEAVVETETTPELETVIGETYLRRRPFLIIETTVRPARGVKTHVAEWHKQEGNVNVTERPSVVDRVTDRHLTNSQVIIDILNRKLVKNRFVGQPDQSVVDHYCEKYSQVITDGLEIWARNNGLGK